MDGTENELKLKFSNEQNWSDINGCEISKQFSIIHNQEEFSKKSSEESSKECTAKQKENFPLFSRFSHPRTHTMNNFSNNSCNRKKNIIRKSKLKQVVGKILSDSKSSISQVNKTIDNLNDSIIKIDTEKVKIWSLETKKLSPGNNCPKRSCFLPKSPYSVLTQDFSTLNLKENNTFSDLTAINFPLKWEDRDLSLSKSFNDDDADDESSVDTVLPDLRALSLSGIALGCSSQARTQEDVSTNELAAYLDNYLHFPKKMSYMAEMMYT